MQINEAIKDKQLRIIGDDGSQLGVMSFDKALVLASEKKMDLVKIVPTATPPVCKIMNYGKYRFEQAKKVKEAKKKQHTVDIKEIRLSLKIDIHDFDTKIDQAVKFLKNGHKIKVSMRFKGREMGHAHFGLEVMKKFANACSDFASIEKPAKIDGRSMLMFLTSKLSSEKVAFSKLRKEEK